MSTPKYNLKNPGVKRIMQEAKELAKESTYEYSAHPLEDNLFEWHFTVRGPKDTEFANGRYHGRILLPNEYPFKPPEIMFLTPNGRFELNKKICLSITGFHPEFWQPAWGIRTVLLAVIGFFPTEAKGAIGGLDYTKEERRKLAKGSLNWACCVCEESMKEALSDTPPDAATVIKEELPSFMISYKKENDEPKEEPASSSTSKTALSTEVNSTTCENKSMNMETSHVKEETTGDPKIILEESISKGEEKKAEIPEASTHQRFVVPSNPQVLGTEQIPQRQQQQQLATPSNGVPVWLDAVIAGLVSFLIVLICRRYIF